MSYYGERRCPTCDEIITSGHFVLPSLGEEGFYICETLKAPPGDFICGATKPLSAEARAEIEAFRERLKAKAAARKDTP